MGKQLFVVIIFVLTVSMASAQKSTEVPNLKDLITWSGMSYAEFQAEMLKFRFNFEEEKKDFWTKLTSYIYLRETLQEGSVVTEKIVFKSTGEGKSSIEVFFLKDIYSLYSTQLSADNFQPTACKAEVGENNKQSCYSNDRYFLTISKSILPAENGKSRISYSALIYQKK